MDSAAANCFSNNDVMVYRNAIHIDILSPKSFYAVNVVLHHVSMAVESSLGNSLQFCQQRGDMRAPSHFNDNSGCKCKGGNYSTS